MVFFGSCLVDETIAKQAQLEPVLRNSNVFTGRFSLAQQTKSLRKPGGEQVVTLRVKKRFDLPPEFCDLAPTNELLIG